MESKRGMLTLPSPLYHRKGIMGMFYKYRDPVMDAEAWYVGQERPDQRYRVEMAAEVWAEDSDDIEDIELVYEVDARDDDEAWEAATDKAVEDLILMGRESTGDFKRNEVMLA